MPGPVRDMSKVARIISIEPKLSQGSSALALYHLLYSIQYAGFFTSPQDHSPVNTRLHSAKHPKTLVMETWKAVTLLYVALLYIRMSYWDKTCRQPTPLCEGAASEQKPSSPFLIRLTAFVLKSFAQARAFIFIDETHITHAFTWLSKQQQDNGCFRSSGSLFNNAMKVAYSELLIIMVT